MKTRSLKAALTVFAAAAILAACHGAGTYMPGVSPLADAAPIAAPGLALPSSLKRLSGVAKVPDGIPVCTAKKVKIPGKYVIFYSSGKVKGSKYTGDPKNSIWERIQLGKATPSPTSSPTTGPTPGPEYVYYGTYALDKGAGGCAYLIATQYGKPFKGQKYNGLVTGSPNIVAEYYKETFVSLGMLNITVTGLGDKGGHGTFVMKNSKGRTYNSGTVSLAGRILVK